MQIQFRFFRRRTGIYYLIDNKTKKQKTLETRDKAEAQRFTQAYIGYVNNDRAVAEDLMKLNSPIHRSRRPVS